MCLRCFETRAVEVVKSGVLGLRKLQNWGFAIGLVSLVPGCWLGLLVGVVVNGLALHRTLRQSEPPRTWMPITGLVLSVVPNVLYLAVPGLLSGLI